MISFAGLTGTEKKAGTAQSADGGIRGKKDR